MLKQNFNKRYSNKDKDLLNFNYVKKIGDYFDSNLLTPFKKILLDNRKNLGKLNNIFRMKFFVFLIKTKICGSFFEKCGTFRKNDIFNLSSEHQRRKNIETKITHVFLGNKDNIESEYRSIGQRVQQLFFSLLIANDFEINFDDSFNFLNDPNYQFKIVSPDKAQEICSKIQNLEKIEILDVKTLFKKFGMTITPELANESELQHCFPRLEFHYIHSQIISSKLFSFDSNLKSPSIEFVQDFFVPLILFEEELTLNFLFPQTRIRLLRNTHFFEKVAQIFLIQKDFLKKNSLSKSMQREFAQHFKQSLEKYIPFDRRAAKSKNSFSLNQRKNQQ